MIKMVGGMFIIGATTLLGMKRASEIQDQYIQTQYLQKLIYMLRSEIFYARSCLGEAFLRIGTSCEEPYKQWLLTIRSQMGQRGGETFPMIWKESTQKCLRYAGLPSEARKQLLSLGGQLGIADIEMQVKNLDLFLAELNLTMEDMREGMKAKVRLYHCLGVMSGIFITVLLV